MSQSLFRALIGIVVGLPLSACGGGGGGGGGGSSPSSLYASPSVNFSSFTGAIEAEGLATQLVLNQNSSGNATGGTIAPSSTRRVYTVNAVANPQTTGPDDAQNIAVAAVGIPTTVGITGQIQGNGAGQYQGYGDGGANGSSMSLSRALKNSLGTTSLSYSYLGAASAVVSNSATSSEIYASAFFGGQKTLTSDMPASGSANYSGAYEGAVITAQIGSRYAGNQTDGSVTMTADFGSGTINGRVDNYRSVVKDANGNVTNSTPINASLSFAGTVTGNRFSGSTSATQQGANTPLTGYTQTGYMQGGFFGPQAAEAAGAMTNRASATGITIYTQGNFGVKKN